MTRSSAVRAGLYLLASLFVFVLTSMLPSPTVTALLRLALVLLLCGVEMLLSQKRTLPFPLRPKKEAISTLLLFPVFLFVTLAVNLLSATLIRYLGIPLPTVAHTPAVLASAVLLAPVTEELLFRGLVLHLLLPYGEKKAILLSALAFSLVHASLFQIPYAFVAGLLLAATAVLGGTLLFPLLFHTVYNLLVYFGDLISPFTLLGVLGILATAAFHFFLSHRPAYTPRKAAPLPLREMIPFGAYALLLVYSTVSAML